MYVLTCLPYIDVSYNIISFSFNFQLSLQIFNNSTQKDNQQRSVFYRLYMYSGASVIRTLLFPSLIVRIGEASGKVSIVVNNDKVFNTVKFSLPFILNSSKLEFSVDTF